MFVKSKRDTDVMDATTLNICKWTFDAFSILNMYETAVTYMISVNINDTVQHSDITFDQNNVFTSRIMPTFLLMAGACICLIPYATIVLKLHGSCSSA